VDKGVDILYFRAEGKEIPIKTLTVALSQIAPSAIHPATTPIAKDSRKSLKSRPLERKSGWDSSVKSLSGGFDSLEVINNSSNEANIPLIDEPADNEAGLHPGHRKSISGSRGNLRSRTSRTPRSNIASRGNLMSRSLQELEEDAVHLSRMSLYMSTPTLNDGSVSPDCRASESKAAQRRVSIAPANLNPQATLAKRRMSFSSRPRPKLKTAARLVDETGPITLHFMSRSFPLPPAAAILFGPYEDAVNAMNGKLTGTSYIAAETHMFELRVNSIE
jgi:hypothetical protein